MAVKLINRHRKFYCALPNYEIFEGIAHSRFIPLFLRYLGD